MKLNKYILFSYSVLLLLLSGFIIYENLSNLDTFDYRILKDIIRSLVIIVLIFIQLLKYIKNHLDLDDVSKKILLFISLFLVLTSNIYHYLYLYYYFNINISINFESDLQLILLVEILSFVFSIAILVLLINENKKKNEILKMFYLSIASITLFILLDYLYLNIFYGPAFYNGVVSNFNYEFIFTLREFIFTTLSIVMIVTSFLHYTLISKNTNKNTKNLNFILFLVSLTLFINAILSDFDFFVIIYFYNYYIISILAFIVFYYGKNDIDKNSNVIKKVKKAEELFE
jgi:hypothetical protein